MAQWLQTERDLYECVDCSPLPSCSLAQAASQDRHWLSGELGRGGNNGGWFYGEQLLVSVRASGAITGWLVGRAGVDDRWMLEAFLSTRCHHMHLLGAPPVPKKRYQRHTIPARDSFGAALAVGWHGTVPYLTDRGFNGDRWLIHWRNTYHMTVIAVPPDNAPRRWNLADKRWLAHHRQIIETVFARLSDVFGLKRLNAHTDWGKLTRLAAKMAAYNLGCYLNRLLDRPDGALATLIS